MWKSTSRAVGEALVNDIRHREMRATFPPEALEQVAAVIRAKRWGGRGRGRPQNLVPGPGQTGTSRL